MGGAAMKVLHRKTLIDKNESWTNLSGRPSLRLWAKLPHLVVFLTCIILLGVTIQMCLRKYLEGSTATADKYQHLSTVPFPELTLCPTEPYREEELQRHGIESRKKIQFHEKWVSNSSVSPAELFPSLVFTLEDLLSMVNVSLEQPFNKSTFKKTDYYFNGRCFSLTFPPCITSLGILEVEAKFLIKTDVFIHHEGQFFSPDSRARVDVSPKNYVKIAVNHEVVSLLASQGTCATGYGPHRTGTFDSCIYTKLHQIMMEGPGCTVPWLPNKSTICIDEAKRSQAFRVYQGNRRNQNNICDQPCVFTNMYFGPPVKMNILALHMTIDNSTEENYFHWSPKGRMDPGEDTGQMVLYFRRNVKVTTEFIRYTELSLLAEIGGYLGLLMGYSLLNVTKLFQVVGIERGKNITHNFLQPVLGWLGCALASLRGDGKDIFAINE